MALTQFFLEKGFFQRLLNVVFRNSGHARLFSQNTKYKKEEKNREKNKMLENKILLARDEYRLVSFFFVLYSVTPIIAIKYLFSILLANIYDIVSGPFTETVLFEGQK